ncbi:NrfD/PsrC family molybdoenzyme membrane anchor subunit [Ramlibacter rhizophilus]|nr:NrfD/PsrC family molybdoenzyme membrane anchor subunit [Ramlibacter rhizophilus]
MLDAPSSTWFTVPTHWGWLIVLHFFLSGLAAGTFFLSALIDLTRPEADRRLARLGYLATLPLLAVVGVILIVDLKRPERFWHMLLANHTLEPMFKPWVPMSIGSWAVLFLGLFALLAFVASFAEWRRPHWTWARRLRPPGALGTTVVVLGAFFALVITGYTGVMISVLNQPVWSDTPLFGMLFNVSAVAMAAALLVLGSRWLGGEIPVVAALQRILAWLLGLQLLVLLALFLNLGDAARGWLNVWGFVLAVGVVVGVVLPLVAALPRKAPRLASLPLAAALVLAGGFLVRTAIVFVPEANLP